MDPRSEEGVAARGELVLAGVLMVLAARAVDGPWAWLIAGLALLATLAAGAGVLGADGRRIPIESLLVPAVLVAGAAASIRLVPVGLGLVPALVLLALVLDRTVGLEQRLLHQAAGATAQDRSRVLLVVVIAGFVAFTGVAALVPGGLVDPAAATGAAPAPLPEEWLAALVVADGMAALLLGYRAAAFRYGTAGAAVLSALTYATVIGIAAGASRAIDLPRLVGPAVLALVLYLWDAVHGSAPARRRDPRFVWEIVLLVLLGAVVVAWNLQLRG